MGSSSPFASPFSHFPDTKSESSRAISDEQFKLFHSIDRNLYALLVQTLGNLPLVSLHVLGFWLFLEHEVCNSSSGLVNTILHWPLNSINKVFNESVLCLIDMHLNNEKSDDEELFFLSRLLRKRVSKINFVANRDMILSRVKVEVNHIYRALQDIPVRRVLLPTTNGNGAFVPIFSTGEANSSNFVPNPAQRYYSKVVGDGRGYFGSKEKIGYPNNESISEYYLSMNRNSGEMVEEKQAEEVVAVDRTIFLTFSRGFPIIESEIWDFFTRNFGNFIESIEMQVVENGEQPLFAKIVSKSVEMVDVVVDGGKAMYYINKKHVYARKFILE